MSHGIAFLPILKMIFYKLNINCPFLMRFVLKGRQFMDFYNKRFHYYNRRSSQHPLYKLKCRATIKPTTFLFICSRFFIISSKYR